MALSRLCHFRRKKNIEVFSNAALDATLTGVQNFDSDSREMFSNFNVFNLLVVQAASPFCVHFAELVVYIRYRALLRCSIHSPAV